jgi:deoxycytidylate deaminase
MNVAYSTAHGSKCLKRQVGAVVVDAVPGRMGEIVGQGFNDNPLGTAACVEEREYGADPQTGKLGRCYRDIVRYESFVSLGEQGARCPKCGEELRTPDNKQPPWRCNNCAVDLERYFWPERAMTLCTAIHAEVAALSNAGRLAKGATLYTTTFPCFQCAERIAHAVIRYIVFTEPYPDVRAAHRLEVAGIEVIRFEGVRSRRFDEIFGNARKRALG